MPQKGSTLSRRPREVDIENADGEPIGLDDLQRSLDTPEHLLLTDEIREIALETIRRVRAIKAAYD